MFFKFLLFSLLVISSVHSVKFNPQTYKLLDELDIDKSFLDDSRVQKERAKIKGHKLNVYERKLKTNLYASIVRKIVQLDTVPNIFYYMAMVESNFNIDYVSSTKAAGIWQFMPLTAKLFNLKINKYTDERRDPVKSTKKAMLFLKAMYKRFDKWYLAAMAYNCGEGRLMRAIRAAQSESLLDLMNEEEGYIPAETRRYIVKIVALASVVNANSTLMKNDWYLKYIDVWLKKVPVKASLNIDAMINTLNLKKDDFFVYNKHLNNKKVMPPYKYYIYVPKEKLEIAKNLDKLSSNSGIKYYVVQSGDTLYNIARKFDLQLKDLIKINDIKSKTLSIGVKLKVMKDKFIVYLVKKGDTISSIARKHKISKREIILSNKLKSHIIRPNDKLNIPKKDS